MVSPRKIKSPRIVRRNNTGRLVGIFFLGALLGIAGWLGFDYGREWAGISAGESGRMVKRLRAAVTALEQERDALSIKLAALERSVQIDREASRLARLDIKRLQSERQDLQKEIEFFRNLVQEGKTGGLRIKDFRLAALAGDREYRYRFVIRQVKDGFGLSEGEIALSLEGERNGQSTRIALEKRPMRFRHYQNVEGTALLPAEFEPRRLLLEITPSSKDLAPLKQQFEWATDG